MKKAVIDASALLALLAQEKGSQEVEKYLPHCMMSAVNFSEVIMVLIRKGVPESKAISITNDLVYDVIPFDKAQGIETAKLNQKAKNLGLSLGDRACLTLGQIKKLPIVTADKIWKKLKGFDVILIR